MKRKLRILLIEASDLDASVIEEILVEGGFKVEMVRIEIAEAMQAALEDQSWDLIISDYILPHFSGIEAISILQRMELEIPCIIVASEIDLDEAMEILQQGAEDCILKENISRLIPSIERTFKNAETRQQQKAKERAQLRDAQVFAQINDSVICLDLEGRITSWNKAAQNLRGWSAKEMVGQSMLVLFDQHLHEDVLQKFADLQQGDEFRGELEEMCKDGSRVWVDVRFSCLVDPQGKPAGYMSIARDVTKQRRNLQRVRFQASLLDQLPSATLVLDLHSRITYWNRGSEKLYGWKEIEVLGQDLAHVLATPTAEREAERIIEEVRRTGSWEGEFAATHRDGTDFPIYLICALLRDQRGEPVGISTVSFDISRHRNTREDRLLDTHHMELATHIANVGVWEASADLKTHLWNDQMFKLWGIDPKNAPSGIDRWKPYIHEDDLERIEAATAQALKEPDSAYDVEFRIRRANDGGLRFIRSLGRVICDSEGKPVRIAGMNLDITDLRLRENALVQALSKEKELVAKARAVDRSKREFLAVMSHEIRRPMSGILGFTELLKQSKALPEECREYVDNIDRSGEELLRVLDDVLDFSRLEANGITLENEAFSLRKMIGEIENNLAPLAKSKKLSLSFHLPSDLADSVQGDSHRIKQILANLVSNAIKFSDEGSVNLELNALKGNDPIVYEFIVKDTGPGIPENMRESIFDPFVQGDSRSSHRTGGAGLGLTISRCLVRLMSGSLTLQSSSEQGSEFRVRIPLSKPLRTINPIVEYPTTPAEQFAQKHPLDVLVVEDDPINLKLIVTLLNKLGYEPRSAINGLEAVALCEEKAPDLIFMDILMPRMDGYDCTEKIRAIETARGLPNSYVIAITASTAPADRARCFAKNMNDYLNKPVKQGSIIRVLLRAFQRSKNLAK